MYVYVLNYDNSPMDSVHPAEARKLLKTGDWKVKRNSPFTIKSKVQLEVESKIVTLGIKFTGDELVCAAVKDGEVVYSCVTDTDNSNKIKSKIERRSNYRRTRRSRKLRYRAPRFNNRTKKNSITPTLRSKLNNILKEVNFVKKILNVGTVNIQGKSYNSDNLNNNINKKDPEWIDIAKAIYAKDNFTCVVCKGKSGDFRLEAHHNIPEVEGGDSSPKNLHTVCKTCHTKITKGKINLKGKKLKKSFKVSNSTQRSHILKLLPNYVDNMNLVYGSEITLQRRNLKKKYSLIQDSILLAGGEILPKNTYIKKNLPKHDYQLAKGIRSQVKIPTGKINGFRKFDMVKYDDTTCYIKGRMSTGYAILQDFFGNKLKFSHTPKLKDMQRLRSRKNWIIRKEATANIC